jgi:hypothetical protein
MKADPCKFQINRTHGNRLKQKISADRSSRNLNGDLKVKTLFTKKLLL